MVILGDGLMVVLTCFHHINKPHLSPSVRGCQPRKTKKQPPGREAAAQAMFDHLWSSLMVEKNHPKKKQYNIDVLY